MTIHVEERYRGAAGIVPQFLSIEDTRGAVAQINEAYAHGGGWHKFEGFTLKFDRDEPTEAYLAYPDDPPMLAIAYMQLRDEFIIMFQSAWCAVVQPDGTYEVARLD